MPEPGGKHDLVGGPAQLARALLALRARRGWGAQRVARAAGISRTTLFQLERGKIACPRAATLFRLARVFRVPVSQLREPEEHFQAHPTGAALPLAGIMAGAGNFDQQTNPVVARLAAQEPRLFSGWNAEDWQILYGTFGTGGALNEQGARQLAERINQERETLRRLRIVMQTHLGGVAASLVDALFASLCAAPTEGWHVPAAPHAAHAGSSPSAASDVARTAG